MTALTTVRSPSGAQFTVANPYAENFSGLLKDLEERGYLADPRQSGGYANRNIDPKQTGGRAVPSYHKFGRAIDINWNDNARGTAGNISPGVARALAGKHGLTWGGDWKNPDAMHFEASGRGNAVLPVEQRGLLSFAGHPQAPVSGLAGGTAPAAPTSNGSSPMPGQGLKVSEPAAYTGGTPGSVSNARRMAQMLMSHGMETGDVRHWTQALGKVLQSGVGAAWGDQANTQEQQGTASGSAALAAALAGGDVGPALANPYSADDAKKLAMDEYTQSRAQARALEIQKAKMAAQASDPMYQAKLKFMQNKANGGGAGASREDDLVKMGINPNSAEGLAYRANGELPAAAYTQMAQRDTKTKSAPNIASGLKTLQDIATNTDDASFTNSVGSIQGSNPDSIVGAGVVGASRLFGEAMNYLEGGTRTPNEVRNGIMGATEALGAAIKPLIRAPGEGVWTDQDQARLISIVGDLAQSNSKDEYYRRLNAVRDRIKSNFNMDIQFDAMPQNAPPASAAPQRNAPMQGMPQAAIGGAPAAPVGPGQVYINPRTGEKITLQNGQWVPVP